MMMSLNRNTVEAVDKVVRETVCFRVKGAVVVPTFVTQMM